MLKMYYLDHIESTIFLFVWFQKKILENAKIELKKQYNFFSHSKTMEKVVIVYGFDYEWKIWDINTNDEILCKSLITHLPVYAAPYVIKETEISKITEKIKEIETTQPEIFVNVQKIAKMRFKTPSWKIVLYGDNLKFDTCYESDGDEDGNGR